MNVLPFSHGAKNKKGKVDQDDAYVCFNIYVKFTQNARRRQDLTASEELMSRFGC